MMLKIRYATEKDVRIILDFIREAKEYQVKQGFVQWDNNYPNKNTITTDIAYKKGYIIISDNIPVGYFALSKFEDEPNYEINWLTDGSHSITFHRFAYELIL